MSRKNSPKREPASSELDLESSIPYILFRLTNKLVQSLRETLAHLNIGQITVAEWRILSSLKSRHGDSTINELVKCTIINQPVISRIVREMQERGLVKKYKQNQDRRVTRVRITKKGDELFNAIYPHLQRSRNQLVDSMSTDDVNQLRTLLKQMQANMGIRPVGS
jgi:DNA-binding MarR family transcriptional regulator